MVGRPWSGWRAKAALLRPLTVPQPGLAFHRTLQYPDLAAVEAAGGPVLAPYQGLAAAWDAYNAATLPDYSRFLSALARRRGRPLGSVLDLACGTGLLSDRLAAVAGRVVGLDASGPMLAVARRRPAAGAAPEYLQGDFRGFDLGERFDAAVCACNSLNYVAGPRELVRVLAAVARHLRPGGVFAFDTTTERHMRLTAGLYLHAELAGRRFALRFDYDPAARRQTAAAILPEGVETHRRVPIDPADVREAAARAGLAVVDYFSSPLVPGWCHVGPLCFFVLCRPG